MSAQDKDNIQLIMALPVESQGIFENAGVCIHYSGLGKVNAAFKTAEVILTTGCKSIINLGTAGSSKFNTHALIECSGFVQRDIDLTPLGFDHGVTPYEDSSFLIDCHTMLKHLPCGICGSGDCFETSTPKVACDLVDMEGYAIAKVCKRYDVKFTSVKYISDGADHLACNDWVANLPKAAKALFDCYVEYKNSLNDKEL